MEPSEIGHIVGFPAFGYRVTILFTDNIVASREKRANQFGIFERDGSGIKGLHSFNKSVPHGMIFLTNESSIGAIVHECSHAIWQMFKWIGAEFENEIFAYHIGYLVDECIALKPKSEKAKLNN